MIVSNDQLRAVFSDINKHKRIAIDTETTGLSPYQREEIFSLIIATTHKEYYFNFNTSSDHMGAIPLKQYQLDKQEVAIQFNKLNKKLVFAHNFKFDAHFLMNEGFNLMNHDWHDTMTMQMLVDNTTKKLGLADLAEKLDIVKQYISKHKLYINEEIEGKKTQRRNEFYALVPLHVIVPYGLQDARVCYDLGIKQLNKIQCKEVYENEKKLTKVLYKMEAVGVKINSKYCKEAAIFEIEQAGQHKKKFQKLSGKDDPENRSQLIEALVEAGEELPLTEKGNPQANKNTLEKLETEVGKEVVKYRYRQKRYATYFKNFIDLADNNDIMHCSYNQNVATARLSCRTPNLQNISKEE